MPGKTNIAKIRNQLAELALEQVQLQQRLLYVQLQRIALQRKCAGFDEAVQTKPSAALLQLLSVNPKLNNRQLAEAVYGDSGPVERNRVKVLLAGLKRKGVLQKNPAGWRVAG